jgi:hypothetical protein
VIRDQYQASLGELVPEPERSVVAVEPPGAEPGTWAGAPSALMVGEEIFLAYRLRRPVGKGRGYAVAVARSADGVRFETVAVIGKDEMDTESLERPALVLTPDGTWRLYLSCATWGTQHWRVELLEASALDKFEPRQRTTVLPGDSGSAVKDPVIVRHGGSWHLWASVHPLDDPASTDRMRTDYATSPDGIDWTFHGPALSPRPGAWDARGVRVSAVRFGTDGVVAYYDGRASAKENYEERTGIAVGISPAELTAVGSAPLGFSAEGAGGLRYVQIVDLGDGRERMYYELTRADGRHELRTELRFAPAWSASGVVSAEAAPLAS